MKKSGSFLSPSALKRYAAVLLCLAVFYLAAGSFLHRHACGQDTVCHVCQSLHAPALATAGGLLLTTPEVSGWHEARPIEASAGNQVSLYHAGRAPPSA